MLLHQCVVVPSETTLHRLALWPLHFGWYGVTLFFVLSGYLITGVLLDTREAPRRVSSFYARRALRILPLYFVLLAVVFGASLAAGGAFGVGELTTLQAASFWLLLGNWAQSAADSFLVGPLAVTWSVAIEEQFYLVWPWVVWSTRRRTLGWLCLVIMVACPVARLLALGSGWGDIAVYTATWARVDALAVGSLAAAAVRGGWSFDRRGLWRLLLGCGLLAGAGDLVGWLQSDSDRYFCQPFSLGGGMTLGALAAGALLVLLREGDRGSALVRAFEAPWLRSLGRYSYGIYLTHGPIRALVRDHLFGPADGAATPLMPFPTDAAGELVALGLYLALCLPLCWAGGWLSYRLVESPALRLKRRFSPGDSSR